MNPIIACREHSKLLTTRNDQRNALLIRRQHVPMGYDQVIDQMPNLIETQFGGGVRIEHSGVIDMFTLAGEGRFHRQALNVEIGLHERG